MIHLTKEPLVEEYSIAAQVSTRCTALYCTVLYRTSRGTVVLHVSEEVLQLRLQGFQEGAESLPGAQRLRCVVLVSRVQVWRLSSCDLCEVARNSVYQSGFWHPVKVRRASSALPVKVRRASSALPVKVRRACSTLPVKVRRGTSASHEFSFWHPVKVKRSSLQDSSSLFFIFSAWNLHCRSPGCAPSTSSTTEPHFDFHLFFLERLCCAGALGGPPVLQQSLTLTVLFFSSFFLHFRSTGWAPCTTSGGTEGTISSARMCPTFGWSFGTRY